MSRGDDKRPIDRIREFALSMQIGTPEDGAVSMMIDTENALYVVKERAIYGVQLADQVDPERTNVAVPNTLQRLLSVGTHNPEVARIFLTAYTMCKSTHLGTGFPEREAWSHAFEYLRDTVAMMETRFALVKAIKEAVGWVPQSSCKGPKHYAARSG